MPTITKSIGTSGRDYSSITSWEADLDNGAVYASGDDAVGECYDDSAFDESVILNGGGTVGLTSVTLSVASTERHDGTAGTGARIKATTTARNLANTSFSPTGGFFIRWLEIDNNDLTSSSNTVINIGLGGSNPNAVSHLIIHGQVGVALGHVGIRLFGGGTNRAIHNVIVYRLITTWSGFSSTQLGINNDGSGIKCWNVTAHQIQSTHASATGNATGFRIQDTASGQPRNCLATQVTVAGSGAARGFEDTSYTTGSADHNASEDATASGTGSLTGIDPADQYVSTVLGAEDLHLKAGADCIGAGADLGTSPTGVNLDIDGFDRDASGVVWDIGADQFVPLGHPALRRFGSTPYMANLNPIGLSGVELH